MIRYFKYILFIVFLSLTFFINKAYSQIDEQYYGEKFRLLIAVWPENIRSSCSVYVDEDELNFENRNQMNSVFISKQFNRNQIDSIKIVCKNYYTYKIENYHFVKPGINIYPVLLSKRISYKKPKDSNLEPYNLKNNFVLKLKKFTVPDSLKENVYYRDLDVDKDSNLFVVDAINNRIINDKMELKGFELDSPEGITIDSEGNIFVTDWGNHRVVVYNLEGDTVMSFGEKGTLGINKNPNSGKKVQFVFPTRIAVAEDTNSYNFALGNQSYQLKKQKHIYISDRFGIHKVDSFGCFLETVIAAQNDYPEASFYGVAIKGYGEKSQLYFVDRQKKKIKVVASK